MFKRMELPCLSVHPVRHPLSSRGESHGSLPCSCLPWEVWSVPQSELCCEKNTQICSIFNWLVEDKQAWTEELGWREAGKGCRVKVGLQPLGPGRHAVERPGKAGIENSVFPKAYLNIFNLKETLGVCKKGAQWNNCTIVQPDSWHLFWYGPYFPPFNIVQRSAKMLHLIAHYISAKMGNLIHECKDVRRKDSVAFSIWW